MAMPQQSTHQNSISYTYFQLFKLFVSSQGYRYYKKPRDVPYGYQVSITDEKTRIHVTFFRNGTVQVQGQDGDLLASVVQWRNSNHIH